jgi:tetratricopeptide (TPR) repeat protein
VRDAAYGALLKRDRAGLHERFVDWLQSAGSRPEELEEILAYHLEQAHRYLSDLGPLDDAGRVLGARGAALLTGAGRRAFAREDMPAAANLLGRAAALLPAADPARLELLPPLGEALMDVGDFAVAEGHLAEAVTLARAAGERRLGALATLVLLLVRGHAGGPDDWSEDVALEAQATLPALADAGDEAGQATAWRVTAWTHGTACRFGAAAEAAEAAIAHATRAGDERQRRRASVQYALAATYGPTHVLEAIPRCEQILAQARGDRRTEGLVMSLLARLEAMRGDFARARELYRAARATLEEMGRSVVASSTSLDSCGVEVLAGDLEAAERELRRDYAALSEMGEKYLLSTVAAELARVLCEQGRDDEAWELNRVAEELTAGDDVTSQALWRSVRGRLLARAGDDPAGALGFAGRAVGLLAETDARDTQADALLDLAEVEGLIGRPADAAAHVREALRMLEAKGNLVAARRASAHAAVV